MMSQHIRRHGMMNDPTASQGEAAWQPLRLAVFDTDDLAVISAHLQDAETTLADMAYVSRTKRFALVMSRFDWTMLTHGQFWRCQAGLHFERVLHVARRGFASAAPGVPERLLAVSFIPGDPPSGTVLLTFASGGQIRLTVECLEAEMRDMGPRWSVRERPRPRLDAGQAIG
jgi:hypothetical protein